MEKKEHLHPSEIKLLSLVRPIGNSVVKRKWNKMSQKTTLGGAIGCISDICQSVSPELKEKENMPLYQICRAGSRMLDNNICVQLYEDGDNLMRWAVENGSVAIVTDHQIDGLPCIVTDSPVAVYARLCSYLKTRGKYEVTAVVGSIGKTTTKKMVSSVYAASFNTFADPENENQIDCVGYICQHIPAKTEKLVQEVSEDTPGVVHYMSEMLKPRIAVVTAIDKSHIEAFGDEEGIYKEILSIVDYMPEDGILVVNKDEYNFEKYVKGHRVVTVSKDDRSADYYAEGISLDYSGLSFSVVCAANGKKLPVVLHGIFALHNIVYALSAIAAGVSAGASFEKAVKGICKFRTTGIRQNFYDTLFGRNRLYVDCYNAVARSVKSAITTSDKIPSRGRKIAVLGDVEEAGETSELIHREIIETVNRSGFNILLAFGPKIGKAVDEVKTREDLKVMTYGNKKDLMNKVKSLCGNNNLFCFKASRKSALESCVQKAWPLTYRIEMLSYYWPIIRWRMKVILN